jgi:RNA polymerase sigma factor (sigma-70 family)
LSGRDISDFPFPVQLVSTPENFDRWFGEQVLPHEPALRAWLRARYPTLIDSDDIVQEAYARVLRARAAGPIDSPKAFLFATARNLVIDSFRRRNVTQIEPLTEIDRENVLEEVPTVAETVSHRQELEILTLAIQSLPERCRQVLTLRKIYGLSQKQIAATLDISEHTVEAQVGIGVRRCAEFLARYGLP